MAAAITAVNALQACRQPPGCGCCRRVRRLDGAASTPACLFCSCGGRHPPPGGRERTTGFAGGRGGAGCRWPGGSTARHSAPRAKVRAASRSDRARSRSAGLANARPHDKGDWAAAEHHPEDGRPPYPARLRARLVFAPVPRPRCSRCSTTWSRADRENSRWHARRPTLRS